MMYTQPPIAAILNERLLRGNQDVGARHKSLSSGRAQRLGKNSWAGRLWCTICGMTKRSYKIGHNREQVSLLPPCIEDYVGRDNPVRAIDAYVDSLDLHALDFRDVGSDGGASQPPYDPADLLKLYLYGNLNQVRSSRRLEREARRNTEVIWLLRGLTPGYRTIANFRKSLPSGWPKARPGGQRGRAASTSLWCWPAAWTCWAGSWWRSTARSFTAMPAKPAS